MKIKCPACSSENVEQTLIMNTLILSCKDCGYDESDALEVGIEKSKKKARSVYRTGGGRRSAVKSRQK